MIRRSVRGLIASRFAPVAVAVLGAWPPCLASAQAPAPLVEQSATVSISGIVFDSLAQKPLTAARVELVNADSVSAPARTIETDSLGHFRFDSVRPGRYLIGFVHPILDSIGVERTPRALTVDGVSPVVTIDLALPSRHSLRIALCGEAAVADSESLIMGIIRSASTRSAMASSTVTVEWADIAFAAGALKRSIQRRTFKTQETGWFSLCGAPIAGTIVLSASHGADSTEALELEMPADGFLRRDLFFGESHPVASDTVATATDSLATTPGPRRSGDGRVTGTVVTATGGRPLAGARVAIRNGPVTLADAHGDFTLIGVPTGTRMLEVRAVTYAPLELPVDVVEGAAPVRVALVSVKALLDTVKVRANLTGDHNEQEFMKRRKFAGAGRFITAQDIAKRNPVAIVDIFRSMPGIMIARDTNAARSEMLAQRSYSSFEYPFCRVAVFVDGNNIRDPSVDLLNALLRPADLIGIEVYLGGSVPAEFSRRNGCGSVVFWSR